MYLTDDEKRMLDGEQGDAVRKAMMVLVALGEIYGADRLVEINNVHSPGVSYRVTGDAGVSFVKETSAGAQCRVPTTLNTIGIDCERWEELGFPRDFALKQLELLDAYRAIGAIPTYTCTPYLVGNVPVARQHVAWGESSAVAFANSIIGARTNREGGPSALASALTGRTPAYGYHLTDKRKGNYLFRVDMSLSTDLDFAVLGYFAGRIAGKDVPVFEGLEGRRPTLDNLKALGAALASSGAVALYHIVGITPEAPSRDAVIRDADPIVFGPREYEETKARFCLTGEVDLVVTGCPHCSIVELGSVARLLAGRKVRSDFWVCTSRQMKALADKMGYTVTIEASGARVVCDTCPVLSATIPKGYRTLVTNSAKLAHYAPGLWNVRTGLLEIDDCVSAAIKGRWGDAE